MASSPMTGSNTETTPLLTTATAGAAPLVGPISEPASVDRDASVEASGHNSRSSDDAVREQNGTKDGKKRPNMVVIFPAIAIGIFLAAVDGTIVLVSYATISSEFDALNLASWIMTAYTLSVASFQPLYGKLCDIFGRKTCLLAAYSAFALGCLACGSARSIGELIAARVLQAVGGAGLGTVISILLTGLVPARDRGVWQGILNIVYAAGAGLGAPLGGLVAGSVGWRWSFLAQVPICLVAIVLVSVCLDGDVGRTESSLDQQRSGDHQTLLSKLRRVDFLGAISLVVMVASFIFALDRGSNVSWSAPETYASLIVSVVAAAWFTYVESHIAREPIVPLSIVFTAELLPIYLSAFFCFVAIMGLDFILPLYYQARREFSPQQASFYMLPAIMAGVLSALLTGFWMRRSGQYFWALMLAYALQTTGGVGTFLMSGPVAESLIGLVAFQIITELGVGNSVVSGLIGVIAHSSDSSVAILTAMYYSIRNVGCVIGVSTVSTAIQQTLRKILVVELQPYDVDVDAIVEEARRSLDSLRTLDPEIAAIVRDCYGKAITRGFLVILIMASLAIIPALRIRGGKQRKHDDKDVRNSSESEV